MTLRLVRPASREEWLEARRLVEEYAGTLEVDLSFQDFAVEVERLDAVYGPPGGVFLLAEEEGRFVGCAGLRRFAEGVAEMKRLYAVPAARGRGAGRMLAEAVVAAARERGYGTLRLDTLPSMKAARALYLSLGFREIPAYRFNPVHGTTFFELELEGAGG